MARHASEDVKRYFRAVLLRATRGLAVEYEGVSAFADSAEALRYTEVVHRDELFVSFLGVAVGCLPEGGSARAVRIIDRDSAPISREEFMKRYLR